MSTLKELLEQDKEIERQLIEQEGELTPENEAKQLVLETSIPVKIDAYYRILKSLEAGEELLKARADEFLMEAKQRKAARDRLKGNLKYIMETNQLTELSGNDYCFKLSNAKPKLIIQDELVPELYKSEVVTTVIDKDMIAEHLKDNVNIPGCRFEPSFAFRSSVNKKLIK